jgi:hypothetical protein
VTVPFGINQHTLMSSGAARISSLGNPIDYRDYNNSMHHSQNLSDTPND